MYPPAATGADPVLLSMQTWDLRVHSDGNWASAGLRAILQAGAFYRGTSSTITVPVTTEPQREFWTYVTVPDPGGNGNNINILGGFPEGQPLSNGTGNGANVPGTFSCQWGDLATDPPSPPVGYQIARLTFPLYVIPDVLTVDQDPNFSRTSQVTPDSTTAIPEIPEPAALGFISAAALLLMRWTKRGHY